MKILCKLVAASVLFLTSTALWAQDWNYGIGTGLGVLDVDGDSGFATRLLGPVAFDASLDSDEIRELMKSAAAIGGYANRGKLTITYGIAQIELDDDVKATLVSTPGDLDINFKTLAANLEAEYVFAQSGNHRFGILGGVRYTKH